MRHTAVIPATSEGFAPYGSVVAMPAGPPDAEGDTYRFWSRIACYTIDGAAEIGMCTVVRGASPAVAIVEKHMRTPEILLPGDGSFDLPVMLEDDSDKDLKFFRFEAGQAAVINPGVWHGACLPVKAHETTYFVIFKRGTRESDVVQREISPISVTQ